jgi:TfoX/Sxy family transcriptional regulator of competence genes
MLLFGNHSLNHQEALHVTCQENSVNKCVELLWKLVTAARRCVFTSFEVYHRKTIQKLVSKQELAC